MTWAKAAKHLRGGIYSDEVIDELVAKHERLWPDVAPRKCLCG